MQRTDECLLILKNTLRIFRDRGIQVLVLRTFLVSLESQQLDDVLDTIANKSRIILLCSENVLDDRRFLQRAKFKAMLDPTYVYIRPLMVRTKNRQLLPVGLNVTTSSDFTLTQSDLLNIWEVTPTRFDRQLHPDFPGRVQQKFASSNWRLLAAADDPNNVTRITPAVNQMAAQLADAVVLWGKTLDIALRRNLNYNSQRVMFNIMKTIEFSEGFTGHVQFNKYGQRLQTMLLYGWSESRFQASEGKVAQTRLGQFLNFLEWRYGEISKGISKVNPNAFVQPPH